MFSQKATSNPWIRNISLSGIIRHFRLNEIAERAVEKFKLRQIPWFVFFLGLLIRLLLMPFSTHSDLIHMYWIGSRMLYGFEFSFRIQTLLIFIHGIFLKILEPINHNFTQILQFSEEFSRFNFQSFSDWISFVSNPEIYRILFLFKLPYLLFDLMCLFLIFHLTHTFKESRKAFSFYWLNPILIFATYIFGRHEPITIFLILLSLFFINRRNYMSGILILGLAIALRYYALFLLPFVILSIPLQLKDRIKYFSLSIVPWFIVSVIAYYFFDVFDMLNFINWSHDEILLAIKIPVAAWDNIYVFPLAYFLLLIHRINNDRFGITSMVHYCLSVMLLFVAFTYIGQSPQYWTWFIPFLALFTMHNKDIVKFHWWQILFLFIYSFIGNRAFAGYLFAPIHPDFFTSLPGPIDIIYKFTSPELVIGIGRTALTAVTIWMIYMVMRNIIEQPRSFSFFDRKNE